MASKAAKLRAKREARAGDVPDLASVPRAKRRGRARMKDLAAMAPVDESISAIEARCRRAGLDIGKAEAREKHMRDMRAPWHGCAAGRAMALVEERERERADLWAAIQHIRMAWSNYARACGLPPRSAQCLRILLPVGAVQADAASPAPDMRTDDERRDDAQRAWRQAELLVGRYGRATAGITLRCVLDDTPCENAIAMVLALQNVSGYLRGAR